MVFSFVISPPSFKSLFSFYWRLFLSILSSQTDPPILKNVDFTIGILTCWRNERFRSKNGFAIVWGLSRAPVGELLGGSWELGGASNSTKEGLQIHLGTFLGLVCSPLAAEDGLGEGGLGQSVARFGCSPGPH